MNTKWKHLFLVCSICSGSVFADEMDVNPKVEEIREDDGQDASSTTKEVKLPPGLNYISVCMPNGERGPELARSIPLPNHYGMHLEAGLIYLQPRISDSEIAVIHGRGTNPLPTGSSWTNPFRYDLSQSVTFNMEPGLSAGLGFDFKNGWRLLGLVQWLYAKGVYHNPTLNSTEYILTTRNVALFYQATADASQNLGATPRSLDANLVLNYYLLDVTLSRGAFWAKSFSYEPFAGIESVWLQFNGGNYFYNFVETDIPGTLSYVERNFAGFWGVGPLLGVNAYYYITRYFSLFATGLVSVLFGDSRITNYVGFMQVTSSEKIPGFNKYHSEGLQMCPSFRNVVGVALEGPIYADRVSVRFRAGFDVRYYGNQYSNVNRRASSLLNATTLQLNAEAGEIDVSDLGMVGLLVDLAVDF